MTVENMRYIGVIGTSGTKITAKLIYHMLKKEKYKVGLISREEVIIDHEVTELPCNDKLFEYLNQMVMRDIDLIILEMDGEFLREENVNDLVFETIVHTNTQIEDQRLNVKNDLIFQRKILCKLTSNGTLIINVDDESIVKLITGIENRLIISYGLRKRATITASSIDTSEYVKFYGCIQRGISTKSKMEVEPIEFPVSVNIAEEQNVYTVLGAISAVILYGINPNEIENFLKDFSID
ncbi:hypothetical protein IZY60_12965 [Lutibacter sp. B2]|nr:hypothetical protein [Lutibacter sp. B2]